MANTTDSRTGLLIIMSKTCKLFGVAMKASISFLKSLAVVLALSTSFDLAAKELAVDSRYKLDVPLTRF